MPLSWSSVYLLVNLAERGCDERSRRGGQVKGTESRRILAARKHHRNTTIGPGWVKLLTTHRDGTIISYPAARGDDGSVGSVKLSLPTLSTLRSSEKWSRAFRGTSITLAIHIRRRRVIAYETSHETYIVP